MPFSPRTSQGWNMPQLGSYFIEAVNCLTCNESGIGMWVFVCMCIWGEVYGEWAHSLHSGRGSIATFVPMSKHNTHAHSNTVECLWCGLATAPAINSCALVDNDTISDQSNTHTHTRKHTGCHCLARDPEFGLWVTTWGLALFTQAIWTNPWSGQADDLEFKDNPSIQWLGALILQSCNDSKDQIFTKKYTYNKYWESEAIPFSLHRFSIWTFFV